jgi:hypothetical protein
MFGWAAPETDTAVATVPETFEAEMLDIRLPLFIVDPWIFVS